MANPDHLAVIEKGVEAWNAWRDSTPDVVEPDLSQKAPVVNHCVSLLQKPSQQEFNGSSMRRLAGINLYRTNMQWASLYSAYLQGADFEGSELSNTRFDGSDFSSANLCGARLTNASLQNTKFINADLSGTILRNADLSRADLTGANLRYADLSGAKLVGTNLCNADLTGCRVYAVSAWGVNVTGAIQRGLIITDDKGPEISVDDIELGQFLYLLIDNSRIRKAIDTITSKVVLVLGRFTEERKAVLDRIRQELLNHHYISVVFDFAQPTNRSTDETITLLARMAKFVIADISDAKSILQELRSIVPDLPTVPVQPIIIQSQEEPGMFDFFHHYPWFLPVFKYSSIEQITEELPNLVIGPESRFQQQRTT
jgi:hypothetical protein